MQQTSYTICLENYVMSQLSDQVSEAMPLHNTLLQWTKTKKEADTQRFLHQFQEQIYNILPKCYVQNCCMGLNVEIMPFSWWNVSSSCICIWGKVTQNVGGSHAVWEHLKHAANHIFYFIYSNWSSSQRTVLHGYSSAFNPLECKKHRSVPGA